MKTTISDAVEVEEFFNAIGLLMRKMRTTTASTLHDLSWTQKSVINRLEIDGPLTTADLARAEGVKPQSMGTAIAELEKLGLIERKAHATDKRQLLIRITAKGRTLRKSGRDERRALFAQMLSHLERRDQEKILAVGPLLKKMVEL